MRVFRLLGYEFRSLKLVQFNLDCVFSSDDGGDAKSTDNDVDKTLVDSLKGRKKKKVDAESILPEVNLDQVRSSFFYLPNPSTYIIVYVFCLNTPTDGVARIFFLSPMPRQGIKLMSALLHIFEGT